MVVLDDQQLSIYHYDYHNNPALCIIAGAGSGKTSTIIRKIVKMIKEDCDPSNFYITTFTRNAANMLKTKMKEHVDEETVNDMNIGTFHHLAYKFLEKYDKLNYNTATSFDKMLFDYYQLIQTDDYIKNENHQYIFIDEYQDINEIQYKIIKHLYQTYKTFLVVIGDDQQNIYTFRGSSIEYILKFKDEFEGEILKLETNYRCYPNIVTVSNYLLEYNHNKIDKIFKSPISKSNIKTKIKLNIRDDIDHLFFYLYDLIKDDHHNLSKYAIISRYKQRLNTLEYKFSKHKIPTLYLESVTDNIKRQNDQTQHNRITLTTIHGTKGLEYEHVIFLDFCYTTIKKKIDISEERRLYYVAITRAIDNLDIIIFGKPSAFLIEIFQKASDNLTLFNNFDIEFIKNYEMNSLNDNDDHRYISVSEYVKHVNWFDLIKLDDIIKIIDISYEEKNIHSKIKSLINHKYNQNQLITNYDFLIGYFIESYIYYQLSLENDDIFMHHFLQYIMIRENNFKNLIKNPSYENKFRSYYKFNLDMNMTEYAKQNKSYFEKLRCVFDTKDSEKWFLDKSIIAYNNLIKKDTSNLINDILYYSINISINNTSRYALQHLNLSPFEKLFEKANLLTVNKFINLLNDDLILCSNSKIIIQKTVSYKNLFGCIDILLEDDEQFMILDIKGSQKNTANIEYLLQVLIYSCMYMVETDKKFNDVYIYLPLHGILYKWNITDINNDICEKFLDMIIS